MEDLLNISGRIPQEILDVYNEIELALGLYSPYKLYLVGGAIRDILLYQEPRDYDFVIIGTPITDSEETPLEHLKKKLDGAILYGKHYPVLQYKGHEITYGTSIEEDAAKRDFTINSCYLQIFPTRLRYNYPGTFPDDIRDRVLRLNRDAEEMFTENPLKILRAIRLASTKHLQIEKETYYEIFRLRNLLEDESLFGDAFYREIVKAFTSHHAYEFVRMLDEFELLKFFFPAVHALKEIDGGHYHNETVFSHVLGALKALDDTNLPFDLKLAALYHDVGKVKWEVLPDGRRRFTRHAILGAELAEADLRRLKFPRGIKLSLKTYVYNHMAQMDGRKSILKLKRALDKAKIPLKNFLYLRYSDNKGSHKKKTDFMDIWRRYKFCLKIVNPKHVISVLDLDVNGKDLILGLHINQGKEIGFILSSLLSLWQEGHVQNEKEILLEASRVIHENYMKSEELEITEEMKQQFRSLKVDA